MKKELSWGNGKDTIILEPIAPIGYNNYKIWSYCKDHEAFHKKFGGSCYYKSHSGLSGSGWIPNNLKTAGLIFPGTVRTDLSSWEFYSGQNAAPGMELYIPYKKDQGVVGDYAVVRYNEYCKHKFNLYLPNGREDIEENYEQITSCRTYERPGMDIIFDSGVRLALLPIWQNNENEQIITVVPWDGYWKEGVIIPHGGNPHGGSKITYYYANTYSRKAFSIMKQAEKLVINQFEKGFPDRNRFEKKLGLIMVDGEYHGHTPAYIKKDTLNPWARDFENRGWCYAGHHMWIRRNNFFDKIEFVMYAREGKYKDCFCEWEMTAYEYNQYPISRHFHNGKIGLKDVYDRKLERKPDSTDYSLY